MLDWRTITLGPIYGPAWPLTFTDADWAQSLDAAQVQELAREYGELMWEDYLLVRASAEAKNAEAQARGETPPMPLRRIFPPLPGPSAYELEIQPWHVIVSEALALHVLPTRAVAYVFETASDPSTALQEYLDTHHVLPHHLIDTAEDTASDHSSQQSASSDADPSEDSDGSRHASPSP